MVKKAKKKVQAELPVSSDGHYVIRNNTHALLALEKAAGLIEEIEKIKLENDLAGKEATYEELRRALRGFQTENKVAEVTNGKWKSLLVERTGSKWLWDDDDMNTLPVEWGDSNTRPLKTIIEEKFATNADRIIRKVTSRVFDPAKLDDAVKKGILTAEEIAPAFLNFIQTTYVQVSRKK